ncbi:DDE-type integrase/transposase/recombinase [Yersinia mollaretii]|uniref:DDE-type integrase/transposase/recombinase n=1 Tax=Yersinia mollaretii TaxID=33060 RepID=UPI0011AA428F
MSCSNTAVLERINNLLFFYSLWPLLIDVRRIKYLNNRVEQDHSGIKSIKKDTLCFKSIETAEASMAGIELHRMLKKEQIDDTGTTLAWKQFYSLPA